MVAETPSAVLPNSDSTLDESVASKKTDSILRAATQDLLTLMKLDVRDPAASSGWGCGAGGGGVVCLSWRPCPQKSPASSGSCSRVGVAMATPSPRQGSGRRLLVLMLMSRRPPPRAAWAPCPLGAHRGQGTTQVANRGFKMCLHHVHVFYLSFPLA